MEESKYYYFGGVCISLSLRVQDLFLVQVPIYNVDKISRSYNSGVFLYL